MGVNQEARAGLAWTALVDAAAKQTTITYTDLGIAIGVHHRHLNRPLGILQDHCLENRLPPLTILVHQKAGVHGSGFIAWDVEDLKQGYTKVHSFNWRALVNPFAYAIEGSTQEQLAERLVNAPARSEEVYREVADRGIAQQIFRIALLNAYDGRCSFCGFGFPDALEAAHIVPWSHATAAKRMDVRNGHLLCATHHRLFDAGWLRVTDTYTIQHLEGDGRYEEIDATLTTALHGQQLRMPNSETHSPSREMLLMRAVLCQDAPTDEEDEATT